MKHGLLVSLFICSFFSANYAFSWGQRGHQVVSRVAVALLKDRNENKAALWHPFFERNDMLAHLVNIPDIYWKSLPRDTTDYLNPTHWFDVEYVTTDLNAIPADIEKVYEMMRQQCESGPIKKRLTCAQAKDVNFVLNIGGSVPWRIEQFTRLMTESLQDLQTRVKQRTASRELLVDRVNTALLYAGLLGHFVGDSAQPIHLSADYDGWERNQGGLHHYFEESIVDLMPLDLDQQVFQYAKTQDPLKKILTLAKNRRTGTNDQELQIIDIALALAYDSFSKIDYLYGLDQKGIVEKPSQRDEKTKTLAQRKAASEGVKVLGELAIERLAYGAAVLSYLWEVAWIQAGRPDLSSYNSYFYHLKPDPIPPDYMNYPKNIFSTASGK